MASSHSELCGRIGLGSVGLWLNLPCSSNSTKCVLCCAARESCSAPTLSSRHQISRPIPTSPKPGWFRRSAVPWTSHTDTRWLSLCRVAVPQLVRQQFLNRGVEVIGGGNLGGRRVAGGNDLVAHFQQRFEAGHIGGQQDALRQG